MDLHGAETLGAGEHWDSAGGAGVRLIDIYLRVEEAHIFATLESIVAQFILLKLKISKFGVRHAMQHFMVRGGTRF